MNPKDQKHDLKKNLLQEGSLWVSLAEGRLFYSSKEDGAVFANFKCSGEPRNSRSTRIIAFEVQLFFYQSSDLGIEDLLSLCI